MATEIMVHRGNQIGGCITEISTETTRVLIDFGEELPGSRNPEKFQVDWEGSGKKPAVSAVFFTHYHGDHIGRFAEVPETVPLYMSPLAREVLLNIHNALWDRARKRFQQNGQDADLETMEREEKIGNLLRDEKRVRVFAPGIERMMQPVTAGDITVTPCRVDHSASEACMFLIQAGSRTFLHTGDFRGHGLAGQEGEAVLEDIRAFAAQMPLDSLIIEGTMMTRRDEKPYSEADLQKAADLLFRDHRHVFLLVSSTNLDSILTFYQAARAQDIPFYCLNDYQASQLKTLGRYAREQLGIEGLERVKKFSDVPDEEKRAEFVTLINAYSHTLVERFRDCHPVVVYSLWQGYVTRPPDQGGNTAYQEFVRACRDSGISVIPPVDGSESPYPPMHTSGHANPDLIAKVIQTANPGEIRPIHTEDAASFLQLNIPDPLKERIYLGGYNREKDHRYLDKAALEKFLPGGTHRAFVELVQAHPRELAFCFRGNSGDAAVIYYRNHAAFHITSRGYVKFNFDHARYMKNQEWLAHRTLLKHFGYSFEKKQETQPKDGSESIGYVTMPSQRAGKLVAEDLEILYGSIREMIDSFFIEKALTEKSIQQRLFLHPACKKLESGCFFYDLEFSQPYGKLLGCKNQPDMMAIRFDSAGKPESLVFGEIKSRPEALGGDSGLEAHIRGMECYPDWLLPIRGRDACHILNQYTELGLMCSSRRFEFEEDDFARLPKEILLIFTGKDTLELLGELKKKNRGLMDGYTPATDEFSQLSDIGPVEVYRKSFAG